MEEGLQAFLRHLGIPGMNVVSEIAARFNGNALRRVHRYFPNTM